MTAFLHDENGGAGALDFVLTTIWYYPVVMCTIQFILILNAYQYVKYAAYYAARSAAVVIPEEYPNEGRNVWRDNGKKEETVHQAAAWALSPVSPMTATVSRINPNALAYTSKYYLGIRAISAPLLSDRGKLSPNARWDFRELKYGNAWAQTYNGVNLVDRKAKDPILPGDPVTIEVKYDYYLAWPLAGEILRSRGFAFRPLLTSGNYRTLSARCTMINEGWGDRPSHFKKQATKPKPGGFFGSIFGSDDD